MLRLRLAAILSVLSAWALHGGAILASEVKDAESASHGDEAAGYQLIKTYEHPGFKVLQYSLGVLSHYSYLLVSGKEALVVDPGRDAAVYLDTARKQGLSIKGVYLTHSHADFVAGHLEVAGAANCPVFVAELSRAAFKHSPIKEGSVIEVGEAEVRILETPGHTPDGTCGVVYSAGRPRLMFSGDTLFVGSVGRPDLLEGTMSAAELASMGFDTWYGKLSRLPNDVAVLPAHGAGSLCGAHLRDEPSTTIGQERASNPYLQHRARGAYIAAVLEGLPEAPQYFRHNAALNRQGPPPVDWQAAPPAAAADKSLTDPARHYLVDVRSAEDYAAGHVPNSVNIALRGRLETWVGTMVPWGSDLVLCGGPAGLAEAARRLHRVGYSARTVTAEACRQAGLLTARNEMIEPRDLHERMKRGDAPVVVDVRLPSEWMALRIGTVVNLPLNRLAELSAKLDPRQPVVTVCNSAYRSSMAVGILERRGFARVSSMEGGGEAWVEAGLPVFQAAGPGTGPGSARQVVRLPDRISAAALMRLIKDLPGTFDLVDIRPAEQFADYSLPGARNADIPEVIANPAFLTGAGDLILVDRDGSLAMAVGGILSQKTERQVKVLHGGLEAYWKESGLPAPAASGPPGRGAAPRPAPAGPAPAPAAPLPPKKKSAGC